MTTSGTATFDLDVADLIEEAYERVGVVARSGRDFRTARRSLNLLASEWANRGLNLWTVSTSTLAISAGDETYALPADTIDLIEHYIRDDSTDFSLNRISVSDYAAIPNKTTTGRPVQIFIRRTSTPSILLWPVPDQAYTLVYWCLRRMEDASSAVDTMDLPSRFLPAMAAGLAYQLALKRPEAVERMGLLKADYEEQFQRAYEEDRDRGSVFFTPYIA